MQSCERLGRIMGEKKKDACFVSGSPAVEFYLQYIDIFFLGYNIGSVINNVQKVRAPLQGAVRDLKYVLSYKL
jgi:hypothetical protein